MNERWSFLIWQRIPRILGLIVAIMMSVYAAMNIEMLLNIDKNAFAFLVAAIVGWSGILIAWRMQLCGGLTLSLSAVSVFVILRLSHVHYASLFSLTFAFPGLYLIFGALTTRHGPRFALSVVGLIVSPWLIWNAFDFMVFANCASYRSTTIRAVPDFRPGESLGVQKQRLINAFVNDSSQGLNQFFSNWQATSIPISQQELDSLPTAIVHAYSIFEDFYRPHEEKIDNQLLHDATYFIVQNEITVTIRTTLERDHFGEYNSEPLDEFSIENFRPRLRNIQNRYVYLKKDYDRMLSCFLGDDHLPIGWTGDVMDTPTAIGVSLRRQEFLQQMVTVIRGHWSGWRLISDPKVTSIDFVPTLDEAIVMFESVYVGGEAVYYRVDDQWVLANRLFTWIT